MVFLGRFILNNLFFIRQIAIESALSNFMKINLELHRLPIDGINLLSQNESSFQSVGQHI
jgi:hypothetical protein